MPNEKRTPEEIAYCLINDLNNSPEGYVQPCNGIYEKAVPVIAQAIRQAQLDILESDEVGEFMRDPERYGEAFGELKQKLREGK